MEAEGEGEEGAFSDHLLIVVERRVAAAEAREARATAVARGHGRLAKYTREAMREHADALAVEMRSAAAAVACGASSQIDAVTSALVEFARAMECGAMWRVRRRVGNLGQCSERQKLMDWRARLRWALQ